MRDGESDLITLVAFLGLIGAAAVLGLKALPIGFIRRDDTT